jgi:phosphotriesterase-related protein
MVHLDGWGREGHRVLDIVCEEGADITRTILCHMNPSWDDVEYQRSLAERGTYVEYDMMGMTYFYLPNKACPDDLSVLQSISHLICDGFLDRVLISQDVFLKSMFKGYGGLGYTHVLENLTPLYREVGMSAEHLSTIFRDNPRRLLCYLQEDSKL